MVQVAQTVQVVQVVQVMQVMQVMQAMQVVQATLDFGLLLFIQEMMFLPRSLFRYAARRRQ